MSLSRILLKGLVIIAATILIPVIAGAGLLLVGQVVVFVVDRLPIWALAGLVLLYGGLAWAEDREQGGHHKR